MSQVASILVTAALLLLPLVPACVLYLILSPTRRSKAGQDNAAEGKFQAPTWLGSVELQFNVVGSSATYVVLLVFSTLVYVHLHNGSVKEESLRDRNAWLVEVPIKLLSRDDTPIEADNLELQQVQVELEPRFSTASADEIHFWVVPEKGRFPSVRFVYPQAGLRAETLNLNNQSLVEHDYADRRIRGIGPVWLPVGEIYR